AKVSGTLQVTGYSGSLSKAIIQLAQQSPRQVEQSAVSSDGSFEMPQVPSGNYEVKLFNLPEAFLQAVSGPGAKGRFLKVSGANVSVQLTASTGAGKVTGTVIQGETAYAGAM